MYCAISPSCLEPMVCCLSPNLHLSLFNLNENKGLGRDQISRQKVRGDTESTCRQVKKALWVNTAKENKT